MRLLAIAIDRCSAAAHGTHHRFLPRVSHTFLILSAFFMGLKSFYYEVFPEHRGSLRKDTVSVGWFWEDGRA